MLRALKRDDAGQCRWTVSASRRVGSAVDRNRAKRRLRAALRQRPPAAGTDVVVIARPTAVTCAFAELVRDVDALIAQVDERSRTEVKG